MKYPIIILTSLFLVLWGTTHAQEPAGETNNYLVLSKNIRQLQAAMQTAGELAKEDGNQLGTFQLLFCGQTVQDIPENDDFKKLLQQATDRHIKVLVCGLSMRQFHVDPKSMPVQVEMVENGILYSFQKQKTGFFILSI